MKKLLILPLLVLLTGCVTYYYPETALEDGVYYAEDDPSYAVYSGGYTGSVYYPWYSLDYFYLGYYPSPRYSYAYTYPGGFWIGFNYGFSPWYYPSHYYGYYSPWYGSHHHHHYYPAWRPYQGYYSRQHDGRYQKNHHRDERRDRYAGNGQYGSGRNDNDRYDRRNRSDDQDGRDGYSRDRHQSSSVRRYVSTAPSGQDSTRGMVIRNQDSAKVGNSRLHVDQSAPARKANARPAESAVVTQPTYSVTRAGTEVRYRSNTKQTRARTGPVNPAANSGRLVVKAAPANGAGVSNGNDARQASPANTPRQAPVRVVSGQDTGRHNQSRASDSGNNSKPARVSHASSHRTSGKQKSSRADSHR
jgi:hypothetical protein